jgi:uncharacterized membrane protein YphA (DoxX/SURF4 family)
MNFRILHWTSRIILAGVFCYSGIVKLQSPLQFAAALAGYQLFPTGTILPLTRYLPWLELALAALLLIGWQLRFFAAATTALLSLFIIIMGITYVRGINADCGCFGFGEPISLLTLARDALFLIPAVFLAAGSTLPLRWRGLWPGQVPGGPK